MNVTRAAAWAIAVLAIGMWAGSAAAQVGGFSGPIVAGHGPATQPQPGNVLLPAGPGGMNLQVPQGGGFVGGFGEPVVAVPPGAASQPGEALTPADIRRIQNQAGGGMRMQIQQGGGFANGQVIAGQGFGGGGNQTSMSMATEAGRVDYSSTNGDEHLTVADAAGKQLFDGPVNTDEQRKKIPADAVAILKKMVGNRGAMGIVQQAGVAVNVGGGNGGAGAGVGAGIGGGGNAKILLMQAARDPLADLVAKLDSGGRAEEFSRQVGDYTVKVTISGEGKHRATITGKGGQVAFDGPVDTAAQWQAIKDVPADVVKAAWTMDASLAKETEAKKAEAGKAGATCSPDAK